MLGLRGAAPADLRLHAVQPLPNNRLQRVTFTLGATDSDVAQRWASAINNGVAAASPGRPASLLVFVNPVAGAGKVRLFFLKR